jgi:hypothetical protein
MGSEDQVIEESMEGGAPTEWSSSDINRWFGDSEMSFQTTPVLARMLQ